MSTNTIPKLDHGAIGNGRVLALISPTSAIEWLCLPRFDSPSIFARILDASNGGTFRFLTNGSEIRGKMEYLANTNVLRTVFEDGGDRWELIDFAPRLPSGSSVHAPIELIRVARPLAGAPRLTVDFDPRPDYARRQPVLSEGHDAIEVEGGPRNLRLLSNLPLSFIKNRHEITLRRPLHFVLSTVPRAAAPRESEIMHALDETVLGWRRWAKTCALPTFAPEAVLRSALCLKLHAYADTGAIIAATTTSIPEAMGTPRTWDYRYCWLRDAAFVVEALRRLGHLDEGEQFIGYLRDVAEAGPLQPLYGIGGERELAEIMLPHLAGFGGNGHVRVGNAAALQQQNDLNGELILCLETLLTDPRLVLDDPRSYFPLVERLVEHAIAIAPRPDTGIWEFRTMLRPYTFSRAMCWVAIERGARLARRLGHRALAERWERVAAVEREEVLERSFNPTLGYFTQALDGRHPDAANLLLPTLGILDGRDPRFIATLDAYREHLVQSGLMLRYRNDDDFGETTSAFTICSFWWAEALALAGRLEEAVHVFDRVLAYQNPLGLFSEDIDPATGALLGNFPQAYTHVGLVHAAVTIGELLEARDGRVRAWV
ncbi:Glucoamylase [Minicystis rosea]|nr:Glucoamylase [Minicystis rosea]